LNDAFKCFLENNTSEKDIQQSIRIIEKVETFLIDAGKNNNFGHASIEDLKSIVKYLIKNRTNSKKNLLALLKYSRFMGNREIEIGLLELIDGNDILKKLMLKANKVAGEKNREKIFKEILPSQLGTFSVDKPTLTQKFMRTLEAELNLEECREVLLSGPHAGPKKDYLSERKVFLESESIDDFLRKRHEEYLNELGQIMKNRKLYFTQEIDEDVIDYVRNTPSCQNGVRQGNIIYVTKIPYMAKKYFGEKDPKLKRYYYCHCPWVREAIKSDIKISSNFCYCSAGYEKRPWDVIFNQPVKADVMETVLKGDLVCKFAIHIPEEYSKISKQLKRKKRTKSPLETRFPKKV
jgi:hypothetical protein